MWCVFAKVINEYIDKPWRKLKRQVMTIEEKKIDLMRNENGNRFNAVPCLFLLDLFFALV